MRRGGRARARHEDNDEERVVYYDLDVNSHSRDLLLSPETSSAPPQPRPATTTVLGEGSQLLLRRPQQPLFNLDDSGDEAKEEDGEEENPFASLLQVAKANETQESLTRPKGGNEHSFLQAEAAASVNTGVMAKEGAVRRTIGSSNSTVRHPRSILKRSQQIGGPATRNPTGGGKKLGFEAADSRPARWSTRAKPSAADTNNRRKSLSAIQKRRSQLEISAAKRRKSMPPTLSGSQTSLSKSSLCGSVGTVPVVPKRRLLSDVLQRATTLSQQQNDEYSVSQVHENENAMEGDAILDTEHQMRAEAFAPQIFSPTKPATAGTTTGRKPKADAVASKIRGGIGDAIRKAIRKSNRDLTLLRSQGQHLLSHQGSNSSSTGGMTAVESIQERAFVVVCLKQRRTVTPHFVAFECRIHDIGAKLQKTDARMLKDNPSIVLEALFQPAAIQYLKLCPGNLLKIYEPLHFVAEEVAAGSTSDPKWFLLSTHLSEVINDKSTTVLRD